MPGPYVKGPGGEKAWERAKKIVRDQYPNLEKADSKSASVADRDKFFALVTTIYKSICKSPKYDCGPVGEAGGDFEWPSPTTWRGEIVQSGVKRGAPYGIMAYTFTYAGHEWVLYEHPTPPRSGIYTYSMTRDGKYILGTDKKRYARRQELLDKAAQTFKLRESLKRPLTMSEILSEAGGILGGGAEFPPDYRTAKGYLRCGNCAFYWKGWCHLYNYDAEGERVCDAHLPHSADANILTSLRSISKAVTEPSGVQAGDTLPTSPGMGTGGPVEGVDEISVESEELLYAKVQLSAALASGDVQRIAQSKYNLGVALGAAELPIEEARPSTAMGEILRRASMTNRGE